MPTADHRWTCRTCGAVFEQEGFARTCENTHVDLVDILVKDLEGLPGAQYAYAPRSHFPDLLLISNGDGKRAIYTLADTPRKALKGNGAIRLRPPGG